MSEARTVDTGNELVSDIPRAARNAARLGAPERPRIAVTAAEMAALADYPRQFVHRPFGPRAGEGAPVLAVYGIKLMVEDDE